MDKTKASESLLAQIDAMIESQTFLLEAVKAIQVLRDRASKADAMVEDLKDQFHERGLKVDRLEEQMMKERAENLKWAERERKICERESKIYQLEMRCAVAEAQMAAFKEVTGMVFKPLQIRRGIFEMLAADPTYGIGGSSHPSQVIRTGEEVSQE